MYPVYQKYTTNVSDLHGFENPWLIYMMEDCIFPYACVPQERRFLLEYLELFSTCSLMLNP